MEKTIETFDILEGDKIILNTLSDFVDWFSPNKKTNDELQGVILRIGYELEEYHKLKGQN